MRRCILQLMVIPIATALATDSGDAQSALPERRDSVPRDLAEALLTPQVASLGMFWMGSAGPRILVGALPSGLAQRLWLPPGSRVLGGIESSGAGVVIVESALPRDSLTAAYRREQLARGWTVPPPRSLSPDRGFAPAPGSASDPDQALIFCSGGTVLTIGIAPKAGLQEIHAAAMSIGENPCAPPPEREQRAMQMLRARWARYPTLTNPPGASEYSRDCRSWRTSGGGGDASLTWSSPLDSLLAHYGKQLADSGWTRTPGSEVIGASWTRRDSAGTLSEITLTASRAAAMSTCVEMKMGARSR